jgi:hypothetical protein
MILGVNSAIERRLQTGKWNMKPSNQENEAQDKVPMKQNKLRCGKNLTVNVEIEEKRRQSN